MNYLALGAIGLILAYVYEKYRSSANTQSFDTHAPPPSPHASAAPQPASSGPVGATPVSTDIPSYVDTTLTGSYSTPGSPDYIGPAPTIAQSPSDTDLSPLPQEFLTTQKSGAVH